HNTVAFSGIAPQGPMVVAGSHLLVPGGRSIPAELDLKTGHAVKYQLAETGKKGGGAQVAAMGSYFFNGGSAFQLASEKHLGNFGDLVALAPEVGYGYSAGVLKAFDLKTAKVETVEGGDNKGSKTKTTKWKTTQ